MLIWFVIITFAAVFIIPKSPQRNQRLGLWREWVMALDVLLTAISVVAFVLFNFT